MEFILTKATFCLIKFSRVRKSNPRFLEEPKPVRKIQDARLINTTQTPPQKKVNIRKTQNQPPPLHTPAPSREPVTPTKQEP